MQVNAVNSSVAAPGPTQADESRRADDFSRILEKAFFGTGSKAIAKSNEPDLPRTETRPVERPVERAERPAERSVERPRDRTIERNSDTRDQSDRPSETASKPADKPAKTEDKPAARDDAKDAAPADKDATPKTEDKPKTDAAAKPVADKDSAADAEAALDDAAEDVSKSTVATPDAAALILSLLQQTQVPAVTAAPVATTTEGQGKSPAAAVSVAAPVVTADANATALLAAAAATAAQTAADTAVAQQPATTPETAATTTMTAAQVAQTATETSVTALLSQQQTMSKEDFTAIQQAATAQANAKLQADVQTVQPEQPEMQIAQVAAGTTVPKADGKTEKALTVDVQTVAAVPAKTLVDQSVLMSMQGDDSHADAALQQQMQTQDEQRALMQQAATPDVKFNAVLHAQANGEAALLNTGANPASPPHIAAAQGTTAAIATPAAQAAQASQHASNQTLARNLNAYVSAGEQVAVHIKRGAAEGMDKISIRLDPGNLGQVEVKLEVTHDGRLMAVIAADKPETLQMLQKDATSLEQSLRDAGLKTDQQSLSFSLRDQGQAQDGREGHGGGNGRLRRGAGGDDYAEAGRTDPAQLAAANAQRAAAARGGLDLRI